MQFSFKPLLLFCLALSLLVSLFLRPVLRPATAVSLTDSRVSQLEYQVRSLQAQINQLQSNAPASGGSPRPVPAPEAPFIPGDPSLAQQFDNLATLAIELKQRVKALEERVFQ
ncbi:MAG: hypothetical protein WBA76_17425 [Phormidesmis sp.]